MIFKPKIKQVLQTLSMLIIAIVCALSINTLQTHANNDDAAINSWAQSIVDSVGSSNTGGDTTIIHGVWYTKTGYLCYLLDKSGNAVPGTKAVALKSPGYFEHDGAIWVANSRKGGYITDNWSGQAPWNLTPWQESQGGYAATNEPQIKAWFESMNGNVQNAFVFVKDLWGNDMAVKFGEEEVYLVIETMMHFQYSESGGQSASDIFNDTIIKYMYMSDVELMDAASKAGLKYAPYNYHFARDDVERRKVVSYVKNTLVKKLSELFAATYPDGIPTDKSSEGRTLVGDPVIGTVPNLIEYKHAIGTSTTVFNSFTNKVAPFAEMINPGDIGAQIRFIPWTGDTSQQIPDDAVQTYGVAMMVISAKPQGQTTADESKIPNPHAPAKESEGQYSIVKSYRTKQGTQYKDDGTYSISNIGSTILIENEKHYQVVGWKITSTTSTSVSSINWNPPGSIQAEGTTPTSVKIQDPNKCLYVLLEKLEEAPPELEDYNYKITQSSITRRIHFSNPDNPLSNMNNPYIYNHLFTWIGVRHQTQCTGHTFTDECKGHEHTSDCPVKCSDTCTKDHTHVAESCTSEHNCGERCTTQTAYCSDWRWTDNPAPSQTKFKTKITEHPSKMSCYSLFHQQFNSSIPIQFQFQTHTIFQSYIT